MIGIVLHLIGVSGHPDGGHATLCPQSHPQRRWGRPGCMALEWLGSGRNRLSWSTVEGLHQLQGPYFAQSDI